MLLGIVRDNPCGVAVFHQYEGFEIVKKVLVTDVDKLVIKASYLVSALCGQDRKIQGNIYNQHEITFFI